MGEPADLRAFEAALSPRPSTTPDTAEARKAFAAARVLELEEIERRLLELAVDAPDDTAARWLEAWADTAWRDALALAAEHRDDGDVL